MSNETAMTVETRAKIRFESVLRRNVPLFDRIRAEFSEERDRLVAWATVEILRKMYPDFDLLFQGDVIAHDIEESEL